MPQPPAHVYPPHPHYISQHHPLVNIPIPPSILKKTSAYATSPSVPMLAPNKEPPGVPPFPPPELSSDDEDTVESVCVNQTIESRHSTLCRTQIMHNVCTISRLRILQQSRERYDSPTTKRTRSKNRKTRRKRRRRKRRRRETWRKSSPLLCSRRCWRWLARTSINLCERWKWSTRSERPSVPRILTRGCRCSRRRASPVGNPTTTNPATRATTRSWNHPERRITSPGTASSTRLILIRSTRSNTQRCRPWACRLHPCFIDHLRRRYTSGCHRRRHRALGSGYRLVIHEIYCRVLLP